MTMKTTILAALLTVIGAATLAKTIDSTGNAQVRIIANLHNESYKLIYSSETDGPVKFMLMDSEGQILYSEKHSNMKGFIQEFNFEGMPSGDYTFEVTSPSQTFIEAMTYLSRQDELAGKLKINEAEPNRLAVTASDLGTTDLKLYIFDDNQDLVFTEKLDNVDLVNKIYDVNQINSEWVNIVIQHDSETVAEETFALDK